MLTKRQRRVIRMNKNLLKDNLEDLVKLDFSTSPLSDKNFKAVISLTSYKKRINDVHKTINSLINNCKGFRIVLVLAEEEFPQKENELPEKLINFCNYECFEILWVHKNYRSLKKVVFTMDKYRNLPVISADDDMVYKSNYAEVLYNIWLKNRDSFVTYRKSFDYKTKHIETWGFATLHPPYCYGDVAIKALDMIDFNNDIFMNDDLFYSVLRYLLGIEKIISLQKSLREICLPFSTVEGVTRISNRMGKKILEYNEYKKIIETILKDAK